MSRYLLLEAVNVPSWELGSSRLEHFPVVNAPIGAPGWSEHEYLSGRKILIPAGENAGIGRWRSSRRLFLSGSTLPAWRSEHWIRLLNWEWLSVLLSGLDHTVLLPVATDAEIATRIVAVGITCPVTAKLAGFVSLDIECPVSAGSATPSMVTVDIRCDVIAYRLLGRSERCVTGDGVAPEDGSGGAGRLWNYAF